MKRLALLCLLPLALSLSAGACRRAEEGAVKVAVIGNSPRLTEPNSGPLAAGDAILLSSVAQGLVRFDHAGQIEGGLAERWNVSDDGLSYVFRIATTQWSDGQKVTAKQVARLLKQKLADNSRNTLKDTLGAIDEIVPMTDRVIEFRLRAPRPNLLQLLAQPEMSLVRYGRGTGPFTVRDKKGPDGELRLKRQLPEMDGDPEAVEEVWLTGTSPEAGVKAFAAGGAHLLLGGTFTDLPFATARRLPRGALQFDPVAGLFGLLPLPKEGPFADPETRLLLSEAIDRAALVAALNVPGLLPRATILQGGLEGMVQVAGPAWMAAPIADRRPGLAAQAKRLFGSASKRVVVVALPDGPGSDILLRRLQLDWAPLGLDVRRAEPRGAADFRLIDAVAPSTSPAWFLRQFRCGTARICAPLADPLLDSARETPLAGERARLLGEAASLMDEQVLFIPLTAPVRWSLVASRVQGFAGNRFGRHTLTGLQTPSERD